MSLPACVALEDADRAGGVTGAAEVPLKDENGFNQNGLAVSDLNWNGGSGNSETWSGLHTTGLYSSSTSVVTNNVKKWLIGQPNALAAMKYLVGCAVPSDTTVTATINGTAYTWPGKFGLAASWKNSERLSATQQERLTACLLAHVNLDGNHVKVSFRGLGIPTRASELSTYNCREAAFMGNIFAGHADDILPSMQCHEFGATVATGRTCDPLKDSFECVADCSAACDQSSGTITSCDITVNGTSRSYKNILTTFLPTNPAEGCLGWGYNYDNTRADYTEEASKYEWSFDYDWSAPPADSCSWHCGGYTASGCSCAPDCNSGGVSCCEDYQSVCGIPPTWSGPTNGQGACPSGYTSYTGRLDSTNTEDYWPSSKGYTPANVGTHHGTLLGPSGADYDLQLEKLSGGHWSPRGQSERSTADESVHWFYATPGSTFRWRIYRKTGRGNYTFCLKKPS